MARVDKLRAANDRRAEEAIRAIRPAVEGALARLGEEACPVWVAETGQLIRAHPDLSVTGLAALAGVTKATMWGRLRRLRDFAKWIESGQPVYGWGGRRDGAGGKPGRCRERRGPLPLGELARLRRAVGIGQ